MRSLKLCLIVLLVTTVAGCNAAVDIEETENYQAAALLSKSLPEIAKALAEGEITSEQLVTNYLARINRIDKAGPKLQSVLALNPDALEQAKKLDQQRANGEPIGPLHGVPILFKDNIETKDNLATTAGALALKDNITGRDSPLVAGLRSAGAIILGKTNLSQWANFRSENSNSGWSALGGQVRNPHMLDRNPCGSSSGSGAAVAASLSAGAVGTETNGSIICPSNVNGIVGFKPTVGLVSQQYIVPISSTQDTAGPMTKSVAGAAMMLDAMADGEHKVEYFSGLDKDSLKGARVGVLRFSEGSNADIISRFNSALEVLVSAGASLVEIEEFDRTDEFNEASGDVLYYEFKATLNDYLSNAAAEVKTRSLDEIIEFNKEHADIELALFDQSIFEKSADYQDLTSEAYLKSLAIALEQTREKGIDMLIEENSLDFLVSPSGPVAPRVDPINGDVWPSWAGAGWMAAVAGYPHLSVPMGNVHGIPIGFSLIGSKDQDAEILSYGFAYEQLTNLRVDPKYLIDAEQRPEIAAAMQTQ